MRMNRPDRIRPRRFDRRELDVVGPYKENTALGTEMTRYNITRRHDGAKVELRYWRSEWDGYNREDCMVRLLNGWSGDRYDGCLFHALRRTREEEASRDVHDRTHWEMNWFSRDHPDILSTTWPCNLFSIPNENLESLFLLMLEQIEVGIDRIDGVRRELEGLPI